MDAVRRLCQMAAERYERETLLFLLSGHAENICYTI